MDGPVSCKTPETRCTLAPCLDSKTGLESCRVNLARPSSSCANGRHGSSFRSGSEVASGARGRDRDHDLGVDGSGGGDVPLLHAAVEAPRSAKKGSCVAMLILLQLGADIHSAFSLNEGDDKTPSQLMPTGQDSNTFLIC